MARRHELTDAQWAKIQQLLPGKNVREERALLQWFNQLQYAR